MIIDATFWVAISFVIFVGLLVYFKIPQKIKSVLEENIDNINTSNFRFNTKNTRSAHEQIS